MTDEDGWRTYLDVDQFEATLAVAPGYPEITQRDRLGRLAVFVPRTDSLPGFSEAWARCAGEIADHRDIATPTAVITEGRAVYTLDGSPGVEAVFTARGERRPLHDPDLLTWRQAIGEVVEHLADSYAQVTARLVFSRVDLHYLRRPSMLAPR
jgi:hypothetical protein